MQGRLIVECFIKVLVVSYLSYQTFEDIRKKSVSLISIFIFSIISAVINVCLTNTSLLNMFLGVLVGLGVILIGRLMKDGIGIGDGAVLSSIGILIGGEICLLVFIIAITISAVIGTVLLILKKVKMKQELPFIPYILCAYVLVLL